MFFSSEFWIFCYSNACRPGADDTLPRNYYVVKTRFQMIFRKLVIFLYQFDESVNQGRDANVRWIAINPLMIAEDFLRRNGNSRFTFGQLDALAIHL